MRFPACRSYLLAVALSLTARLATPPADFPDSGRTGGDGCSVPATLARRHRKRKTLYPGVPRPLAAPISRPFPHSPGGAGGPRGRRCGRTVGVALAPLAGAGVPRGGSAPHPQLTPFPLPPQELESPEVSQFRLAANRTPEVPFGLSSSPAVLSHYGVATNTVTLFRRVRGPSRVGWGHPRRCCGRRTRGATRGGLRLAPNPFPTGETTVPCKGLLSSSTRWFW